MAGVGADIVGDVVVMGSWMECWMEVDWDIDGRVE